MPMNQFLFDHQVAAMKVDHSGSAEDRKEAAEMLGARAKGMANWRKRNGPSESGSPRDERPPSREDG